MKTESAAFVESVAVKSSVFFNIYSDIMRLVNNSLFLNFRSHAIAINSLLREDDNHPTYYPKVG